MLLFFFCKGKTNEATRLSDNPHIRSRLLDLLTIYGYTETSTKQHTIIKDVEQLTAALYFDPPLTVNFGSIHDISSRTVGMFLPSSIIATILRKLVNSVSQVVIFYFSFILRHVNPLESYLEMLFVGVFFCLVLFRFVVFLTVSYHIVFIIFKARNGCSSSHV